MNNNLISFPGLGLEFNIDRVAFTIFGKPIYWYGLIIALGFLLGVFYALRQCKKQHINEDQVLNFVLIATPVAVIGARLYYVIFNLSNFHNLWDVIKIWEGGNAIYGSVIAGVITLIIFCKVTRMPFYKFVDIASISLMIGQCVGRWGNFVNREAHGGPCDLPWRMEIYSAQYGQVMSVHPTFLYESLWNFVGIILLHNYSKRKKFNGEIFLMYIAWYGLGRALIEGLRTDSLYLWGTGIRVSQLLAGLSFLVAVGLIIYLNHTKKYLKIAGMNMEEEPIVPAAEAEIPAKQLETGKETQPEHTQADRPDDGEQKGEQQ